MAENKWVTGVTTPLGGVIALLITGRVGAHLVPIKGNQHGKGNMDLLGDVLFPIEHVDFPAKHVSLLECTYASTYYIISVE